MGCVYSKYIQVSRLKVSLDWCLSSVSLSLFWRLGGRPLLSSLLFCYSWAALELLTGDVLFWSLTSEPSVKQRSSTDAPEAAGVISQSASPALWPSLKHWRHLIGFTHAAALCPFCRHFRHSALLCLSSVFCSLW